jgi:DNA-nicking Smr family endonuclease
MSEPPDDEDDGDAFDPEAVVEVALGDELDLHAFAPRDVASVVEEYLHAAAARGFREVRVVHGKGVGVQREIVHAVLRRHPVVASFVLADERRGSWGATIVTLRARERP